MLGRRIGYFIVDTLQDYSPNSSLQSIYQSSSKKMKKPGSSSAGGATNQSSIVNPQSIALTTSSDFRSHFEGEIESLMGNGLVLSKKKKKKKKINKKKKKKKKYLNFIND